MYSFKLVGQPDRIMVDLLDSVRARVPSTTIMLFQVVVSGDEVLVITDSLRLYKHLKDKYEQPKPSEPSSVDRRRPPGPDEAGPSRRR